MPVDTPPEKPRHRVIPETDPWVLDYVRRQTDLAHRYLEKKPS